MTPLEAISASPIDANSVMVWAHATQAFEGSLAIGDARYGLRRGHRKVVPVQTDPAADHTIRQLVNGLSPGTEYSYAFGTVDRQQKSILGSVKTAHTADSVTGVRFGFSGCASGEYAPINSTADIGSQGLDFFVMLGDAAYEDDYKRAAADPRGALNSAEVDPPFDPKAPQISSQAYIAESASGMAQKYWDMQNPAIGNLAELYKRQGILSAYDNHEMVDMALEAGGGPRSLVSVYDQWPDRAEGKRSTSFREGGDLASPNVLQNQSGTYLNQSPEHQALVNAWFRAMPLQNLGLVNAPEDPRSHGTQKLYSAQQWGKQAVFINVDTRSYRDAKITALSTQQVKGERRVSENDVTGVEIDQATGANLRTILGSTQLTWLKQTLLDAKNNGTTWSFVALSSPIDITGIPGTDGNFTDGEGWVDAKSWWGNYRYERNDLLKFIADNGIKNVVFIATDDHEARINELTYVPTVRTPADLTNGSLHQKLNGVFSVVASPLGASRPYAWVKDRKTKADIVTAANTWSNELSTAGYDPVGLTSTTPGFVAVRREAIGGHISNAATPQPIDFWSPDTFNYAVMDVSPSGQLTVAFRGIDGENAGTWPAIDGASQVREILSVTLNPIG